MPLPCQHLESLTQQVQPTMDLLRNLDQRYPKVLRENQIRPEDYHPGLVFRSAVESIRGTFIASSVTGRHGMVASLLSFCQEKGSIHEFQRTGKGIRHDFSIILDQRRKKRAALEVKGGEGNSINISERPLWADEFIVWCHLDGAIVNQPRAGANAIIFNRLANELVHRAKIVDVLIIKDLLCGTSARPCPKYSKMPKHPLGVAPCIFLLPKRQPTIKSPHPPTHTLQSVFMPSIILETHEIPKQEWEKHLYYVKIDLKKVKEHWLRETRVSYRGQEVETRSSRTRLD